MRVRDLKALLHNVAPDTIVDGIESVEVMPAWYDGTGCEAISPANGEEAERIVMCDKGQKVVMVDCSLGSFMVRAAAHGVPLDEALSRVRFDVAGSRRDRLITTAKEAYDKMIQAMSAK